jgi:hypothetical protein
MNELEITVWSLHLDELEWGMGNIQLEAFLLLTAIQAKERLNDEFDMKIYFKEASAAYPGFESLYEEWLRKTRCSVGVELKKINGLYTRYRLVHLNTIS